VNAWVEFLKGCGVKAEVQWLPKLEDVPSVQREDSIHLPRFCIGRIRLHERPIDHIDLIKSVGSGGVSTSVDVIGIQEWSRTKVRYEDHFVIRIPKHKLVEPPRAKRKPKRAYWIFGRVLEYQWRGGRIAENLASDATLNRELVDSDEGKVRIRYDANHDGISIMRSHIGMMIEARNGLIRHSREIHTYYNFPTREGLMAYEHIARQVRQYVGLPQS